jgi:diguanylate cyclase (GGDEF)-like protein
MEIRRHRSIIRCMGRSPTRLLLLEANSHAAWRLADSLGPAYAVVRRATLATAEEDLALRPPDCVLCGPEAVPALRRIDPDEPIVARGDAQPAGAQDRVDRSATGELLARVVGYAIERRQRERQLAHVALHDTLTGLPNRVLLADRIRQALARLPRSGGKVAVLHLGINGFKLVDDSLGHDAGDALLVAIAGRIGDVMRPSDTVARLGGDEFALLCDDMLPDSDPQAIAARVLDALAAPFTLGGVPHHLAASIGIAEATAGDSAEHALREADAAMHAAKGRGGGCGRYDADLRRRSMERLTLQNDLHRALDRGELVLHYQPQVALGAGGPTGVEALVRWRHPERGLIPPGEFIGVAEECSLIVPLGRWVLREACAQLARWQRAGGRMAGLTMSVNLSTRQLMQPDLVDDVAAILADAGVDPAQVCLEITETAVLGDADAARARLHALQALGIKLAASTRGEAGDEAAVRGGGTGYSSLSSLNRFPVDVLKIDRSFLEGMEADGGRARGVVGAVIKLADAMGLVPIAEGVEVAAQADELRALGCPSAQGFLWSAARAADELEALIAAAPEPTGPIRVVVCDDAPAMRALVRHTLEVDGDVQVVGEAGDGEAVVALVAETRPDVVLLDLSMPKVDGLEALPRILEAAPWAGVVVLSGRDEAAAAPAALAAGAERFMAKPAGAAAIRDAVLEVGLRAKPG